MKIGDLVRMNTALTPEQYGVGLIQKIVPASRVLSGCEPRLVYHVLWPDGAISCQYDIEIRLVGRVE